MDEPYHHTGRPRIETNTYTHYKDDLLLDFLENYNIDLDGLKCWIKENDFHTLGVEMPTLMHNFCFDLASYLMEQLNVEIIISGEPCFGACDVKISGLLSSGAEGIIHFGNLAIPNIDYAGVRIYFVPLVVKVDLCEVLLIAKSRLKRDRITSVGLVSSVQYIDNIPKIERSRLPESAAVMSRTSLTSLNKLLPPSIILSTASLCSSLRFLLSNLSSWPKPRTAFNGVRNS